MGLFDNKKEEIKEEVVANAYSFLSRERIPLFESTRSLLYEAESHYINEEFLLCDDILAVVVKHIKRNKIVEASEIHRDVSVSISPKTSTRDTNDNQNKE